MCLAQRLCDLSTRSHPLSPSPPTLHFHPPQVYHYHVQLGAPFTFGCFGPILDDSTGNQRLVKLQECRDLYDECGNGDAITITTQGGDQEYERGEPRPVTREPC